MEHRMLGHGLSFSEGKVHHEGGVEDLGEEPSIACNRIVSDRRQSDTLCSDLAMQLQVQ